MATPHMFMAHEPQHLMERAPLHTARNRPITASIAAVSRATPISVAITLLLSLASSLTLMGSSFKNAPSPYVPRNVSFKMGLCTTPTTGFLLIVSPTHTHTKGYPWTKLVVPSTGSTIHVGASVSSGVAPFSELSSSPMKQWSGKLSRSCSKMSFSQALSVSVTRSASPFFVSMVLPSLMALDITSPALSAARSAADAKLLSFSGVSRVAYSVMLAARVRL
mmetsp:Transcript_435/g.1523  ORF Transcript_435/g.1523 Transcript_435/m.1523 type:complete len:221 (-) Transcript_435:231-893(-)